MSPTHLGGMQSFVEDSKKYLSDFDDSSYYPGTLPEQAFFLDLINQYEFKVSCMASWEEQGLAGSGFNFVYHL